MDAQLVAGLEQRVDQLERDLGLPLSKQDPAFSDSITKLERDIEALNLNHLDQTLVEKYQKLKPLLDCADTRKMLSHTLRKAEIVMKSEEEMRQAAKQLEEIQRLKRFMDFDPLHSDCQTDIKEKVAELRPLELRAQALLATTGTVQDKTLELVTDYNAVVRELSELFLQLSKA